MLSLFDLLYPEEEPLPMPDVSDPLCCHNMAAVCVWIHLTKKAQIEGLKIQRPLPNALRLHQECVFVWKLNW